MQKVGRTGRPPEEPAKLKRLTDEAAELICANAEQDWHHLMSTNRRAYVVRRVPYAVAIGTRSFGQHGNLPRLVVRDFDRSPPGVSPSWFTVFKEHVDGTKIDFQLVAGGRRGEKEAFAPAGDVDRMRFWRDFRSELNVGIREKFETGVADQLDALADAAAHASIGALRARRRRLKLTQAEFGRLIGIDPGYLTKLELSDVVTADALDLIEGIFETLDDMKWQTEVGSDHRTRVRSGEEAALVAAGAALRERREKTGMKQGEFATYAGLSGTHYSNLERGAPVGAKSNRLIEAAFAALNGGGPTVA